MRLTLTDKAAAVLTDVPPVALPEVQRRFRATRVHAPDGRVGLNVPHRQVLALTASYRDRLTVDPRMQAWLDRELSPDRLRQRIPADMQTAEWGHQAHTLCVAVSRGRHGCGAGKGAGKSRIALELANLVGPTIWIGKPILWRSAYTDDTIDPRNGQPRGDLPKYFPHLTWASVMGDERDREARVAALREPRDIYAVSCYLVGGVLEALLATPAAALVIDDVESLANAGSELHKCVMDLREHVHIVLWLKADPARDAGDFWPLTRVLDPAGAGSRKQWRDAYSSGRDKHRVLYDDPNKTAACLTSLADRQLVSIVDQSTYWPWGASHPPTVWRYPVELEAVQRKAYEQMAAEESLRLLDADGTVADHISAGSWFDRTEKWRQLISTGAFLYSGSQRRGRKVRYLLGNDPDTGSPFRSPKLRAVHDLLSGRWAGEQVVIWVHFHPEHDAIAWLLRKMRIRFGFLGSQHGAKASMRALDGFTRGDLQVLVTHMKCAGEGMRFDFSRCSIVTTLDHRWRLFWQTVARQHRPPQDRQVEVAALCARDTIDDGHFDNLFRHAGWRRVCHDHLAPRLAAARHQRAS